jgi:CheY-like chemotaxis protein
VKKDVSAPLEVLLVEDDPGDVLMTREALSERVTASRLNVVGDGVDALAYVRREGSFGGARRPDLVMLDLNLPRRSGHEVLADMKSDPALCDIPIVVLTTSSAESDVLESYRLHANAFVTKPVDYDSFVSAVQQIDVFFGDLVRLAHRTH